MKLVFDINKLKAHERADKFIRALKDSHLSDEEIEYFVAALLLALSTTYSKRHKETARAEARKTLKRTCPSKVFKCKKCGLKGTFDSPTD